MTAELRGVGIFGHVWTEPCDRGQGAAGELMRTQMAHFRQRRGRALYLSTTHGSPACRPYEKHGFSGIEPDSDYMIWTDRPQAEFETEYFAPGPVKMENLDWRHWPVAPTLIMADIAGVVRCAPLKLFGRKSCEAELLPWIQGPAQNGRSPQAFVLTKADGAVAGLAGWARDELSAHTVCVDVFCHPAFWHHGGDLLHHVLGQVDVTRCVAFADSAGPEKCALLQSQGFKLAAAWPRRLTVDAAGRRFADLLMFERS